MVWLTISFLLCFEALSGLKINLSRSEDLVLGCSPADCTRISNLLHCKVGYFPFKYLGIPISVFMLFSEDFAPSILKVGNRVLPWSGRYNTTAGKVCVTNARLSSHPIFLMGFYRLSAGTNDGFDKHRNGF